MRHLAEQSAHHWGSEWIICIGLCFLGNSSTALANSDPGRMVDLSYC